MISIVTDPRRRHPRTNQMTKIWSKWASRTVKRTPCRKYKIWKQSKRFIWWNRTCWIFRNSWWNNRIYLHRISMWFMMDNPTRETRIRRWLLSEMTITLMGEMKNILIRSWLLSISKTMDLILKWDLQTGLKAQMKIHLLLKIQTHRSQSCIKHLIYKIVMIKLEV